ncbi:MAG: 50S ribosomal protein L25/general stress protein Ctc [Lentimicrobiaceae bacterium]|jgi:large subunit ribosomal protein L25|nr:50S ribosomal protein L25/general stress protein Ctc [Lentimicrobiaceae bacterium]
MKKVSMSGSPRENVGKKDAKGLRKEGMVPCVLYGGEDQIHFATDAVNFKQILFTPETFLIDIEIGGKTYQSILQDIQYHPLTDKILHADFLLVKENKEVTVTIPVATKGTSPGVIRGGKMKIKLPKLKVKGLAKNLPEYITIDVSNLNVGGSVKVRDMKLDNLTMMDSPNLVIVDVKTARGVVLNAEEETGAAE